MAVVVWKQTLKIHIGELTRADQLEVWRVATEQGLLESSENADTVTVLANTAAADELITARATRAVYVCREGQWVKLDTGETYDHAEDGETVFSLAFPIAPDSLRTLPMSLANQWVQAAIDENGDIRNAFLFASSLLTISQNPNEPA